MSSELPGPTNRFPRSLRRVLVVTAVCYALIVLLAALSVPLPFQVVQSDSLEYLKLASNLAQHGVFGYEASEPSARRELLYPLFLAGFMKIGLIKPFDTAPQHLWPVLLVQAGSYVSALWMLTERARRLSSEAVARTALILGAAYFPVARFTFQILSESLTVFLVSAFFFMLARRNTATERARLTLAAGLLGLLSLIKSVSVPAAPFVAQFLLRTRRATRPLALLFTIVALGFPAAWVARNYARFDRFVPSTSDGASSLYRGNMALGYQPPGWADPAIPEAVRAERDRLGVAADHYLVKLTRQRLLESPREFVLQLFYKLGVLWVGDPRASDGPLIFGLRCILALLIASRIPSLIRDRDPDAQLVLLFAAYQSLLYSALFTIPRYFVPATFLLLPLAASALHRVRLPGFVKRAQVNG